MSDGGMPPDWGNDNRSAPRGLDITRILLIVASVCGLGMICLGLPLALLLPSVRNARESGRRAVCLNNIRNLGLAIASHESQHRQYPGHRQSLTIDSTVVINGEEVNEVPVNWLIAILPHIERPDLYRRWKKMGPVKFAEDGKVTYDFSQANGSPVVYMELLVCPSDPQSPAPAGEGQPMSYVVNSGLQDVQATTSYPADSPFNGVFVSRWEMPQAHGAMPLAMASNNADSVSRGDGVSSTLLISENIGARNYDDCYLNVGGTGSLNKPVSEQWNSFVWQPHYPLPANLAQAQINGPQDGAPQPAVAPNISFARPSSNHPGGANFVFCDVHTKFISEKIDYLVLALLMMSNDRFAQLPGDGGPLPTDFTTTELREEQIP